MTSLSGFLLARIAEDEAVARAATPGPWVRDRDGDISSTIDPDEAVVLTDSGAYPPGPETAEHIVRWNPDRVLAECEAKRRIVERVAEYEQWRETLDLDARGGANLILDTANEMLTYLALPYADHPDYLPVWAP